MGQNRDERILKEIQDVKKLLMLHLLKSGATYNEVRALLKLSGSDIKKLIPIKKIKKYQTKIP